MTNIRPDKKEAIRQLCSLRESIEHNLAQIDILLEIHFAEELAIARQHWIPQIKTALKDNLVWLPRGQYTMDYTLNRIEDSLSNSEIKGVSKYI